jgi:hypothetical protein
LRVYRECALEVEADNGSLGQICLIQWLDSTNEVFVPDLPRLSRHNACIFQCPAKYTKNISPKARSQERLFTIANPCFLKIRKN